MYNTQLVITRGSCKVAKYYYSKYLLQNNKMAICNLVWWRIAADQARLVKYVMKLKLHEFKKIGRRTRLCTVLWFLP